MPAASVGGAWVGNDRCRRWSVPNRCTSLQKGQSSFEQATVPKAARNWLLQAGQVTTENAGHLASQIPSVCEARSNARSKLMR